MLKTVQLETAFRGYTELTQQVKQVVADSGVQEGLCLVHCPHTTAGLTISSFWDLKGLEDLQDEVCRLVPTRIDFKHQFDTPQDAAGHVKSSLMGVGLTLIVHEGKLLIGGSQGIFFLEFDGPRKREYHVKVVSD
ncbi:hypothetical protein CE91St41_04940 [Oscillospiraceae bacterium]|nr:hypothetical protein CE91St40_04960 [Oscillospiraceae bacterium]BDF73605.1 hypothetical protein CE91St41_04940 [Oscillospiraceae bacterium]